MRYLIVCFLIFFYASAAQAAEISDNDRMRGHINKIEKLYADAKSEGDMPLIEEGEALSALATGYAFLNDAERMHDYLSRVRLVNQRWLMIRPYPQLIAAKLAADDLDGARRIFADVPAFMAIVNKPDPVLVPVPEFEGESFLMDTLHIRMEAEMLNERSARLEYAGFLAQYACPLLAEYVAQTNDVDMLGDVLKDCDARKYQAALLIRQGKVTQAFELLRSIQVPHTRSVEGAQIVEYRPFNYGYNDLRLFAECRGGQTSSAELVSLTALTDINPGTVLIVLMELGATDAAYEYVLSHPIKGDPLDEWGAPLGDLFATLVEKRADEKARRLAQVTGLLDQKLGRCWTRCGRHGGPWWLSPVNVTAALAKRADLFAFSLVQEIKDSRAQFMSLMTIYHAIPENSIDQYPNCRGNTQACVRKAMAQMAEDYDGDGHRADGFASFDGVPDPKNLMYAVVSEFARITGDKALADKMAAQVKSPDAHVVPEGNFYTGSAKTIVQLAAEISERYLWEYRGKEVAEKIYPPKHNFPPVPYRSRPKKEERFVYRYPDLSAAIRDMQQDMDQHSWRYYSATLKRDLFLHRSQLDRFENRCLLDRGRTPLKDWPPEPVKQ